jgi:hypothetical protein
MRYSDIVGYSKYAFSEDCPFTAYRSPCINDDQELGDATVLEDAYGANPVDAKDAHLELRGVN